MLVTSATTRNASNATQLRLSAIVRRPVGSRKKKLKANALRIDVDAPSTIPEEAETARIGTR